MMIKQRWSVHHAHKQASRSLEEKESAFEAFKAACRFEGVRYVSGAQSASIDVEDEQETYAEALGLEDGEGASAAELSALPYTPSAYAAEQGFQEVPLASALAVVAREPNSAVLLDVRDDGGEGGPAEALRIPLAKLDEQAAEQLRPFGAVFVLPSGDLRSRQAAVRLHRVYGLEGVAHVAAVD
ncbi:hypothetical protein WJX81_002468 [Elliptochloris bilobata]|uniref:Rhodanese domain-containing protein n=1 Tax=Elliptochloris bilobata TaxID=381761 RepID=A0AAW1QWD7_9CHLO